MSEVDEKEIRPKKNCYNCAYLDYYEADYEEYSDSGYTCEGVDYYRYSNPDKRESEHLRQLQLPHYKERAKRCCKLSDKAIKALEGRGK